MFWYILLAISVILTIVGIAFNSKVYEDWWFAMWLISMVIAIILGLLVICSVVSYKKDIAVFKQQKYYIEQVAPTLSQSDNYALTQKRIELNQWLYEMKYRKQNYGIFTLAPDEILYLEEIK